MAIRRHGSDAYGIPKAVPQKELDAMGTYPHRTDPSQEQSADHATNDAEPVIPPPLPQDGRRRSRAAIAVMLVALAIIVLVVLL
jgi:hypothetical protein